MTAQAAPRWTEWMRVGDLPTARRNPKGHDASIGSSIDRFSFADAPILDERTGRLVAGHGRRARLLELESAGGEPPEGIVAGPDGRWQVLVQRGWRSVDDGEAEAFLLAHNKTSEAGGWETEDLGAMIRDLDSLDVSLEGLGFSDVELQALLEEPEDPDGAGNDPDAGAPPANPVSQVGELYALGPHRLYVGDSTDEACVGALLGGEAIDLTWTDPPYGISLGTGGGDLGRGGKFAKRADRGAMAGDELDLEDLENLWAASLGHAFQHSRAGAAFYAACSCKPELLVASIAGLARSGFAAKWTLSWSKPVFVLGRADYHPQWEPILYGWKPGKGHAWYGGRKQGSVFSTPKPRDSGDHPSRKPTELVETMIVNSSRKGDVVFDPFLGSGTTLIACARKGRRCYGLELSPAYADVIRKRWGEWARAAGEDPGPDAL